MGAQQQGFDYTYDKRLYDRLHAQDADAVRGHLLGDAEFQGRSARFLENHDEPRAAAVFPPSVHRAAAIIAFMVRGLRFIHEGQRSGRRLRTSNHLRRRSTEAVDREMEAFYDRLFAVVRRPEVRDGDWQLLERQPASDGNPTWDRFIAFSWEGSGQRLLVAVNYGPTQGQCYIRLPWPDLEGRTWVLNDLVNAAVSYERDGADLARRGLYLPLRGRGAVLEADVPVDAVLGRGLLARSCRIDGPSAIALRRPRPERVAEREHVRVRADAGVAEQVPGAADGVARLEDRVGLARGTRLDVVGGADARQAGADDEDVEVF